MTKLHTYAHVILIVCLSNQFDQGAAVPVEQSRYIQKVNISKYCMICLASACLSLMVITLLICMNQLSLPDILRSCILLSRLAASMPAHCIDSLIRSCLLLIYFRRRRILMMTRRR